MASSKGLLLLSVYKKHDSHTEKLGNDYHVSSVSISLQRAWGTPDPGAGQEARELGA